MHTNLRRQQFPAEGLKTSEVNSCKLKSSCYKGVVPQHNGRWGAQIYECHRRIWLGTFTDEVAAAHVYDIAAQRFRGTEAAINFKRLRSSDPEDAAELLFLSSHTKTEIVRMLRNHTYQEELKNSMRKHQLGRDSDPRKPRNKSLIEFLFNKTVTPSDVGKLNRLVIPKQHAEKHFPINKDDKLSINFQDGEGKVWRFTYSYWNSSQSYVMTKGWRLFVKEKGVKEGDVISFWSSIDGSGFKQCLIDVFPRSSREDCFVPTSTDQEHGQDQVTIRLFGVNICPTKANKSHEYDEAFRNGKTERKMELLTST